MMIAESFLHRVQGIAVGKTFDGRDRSALGLQRQHVAGLHRVAVHMHGAGAALRGVAADMRAGEAQCFAQEMNEQGTPLDLGRDGLAVHRHLNGGHSDPPNELLWLGATSCLFSRPRPPAIST